MASKALAKKDVPLCLLALVVLATSCHICVLIGNHATAKGLETMGRSTKGWSGIGLGISHSLQHELDVVMANMSDGLLKAINHTLQTSELLTTVTSLAGFAADHIAGSDATKAITLLQDHMSMAGAPLGLLPGLLISSADKLLDKLLKKAIEALDTLLETIKPVLQEVGKFIIKFGDRVQTVIETFSITLDGVQKLFDQIMGTISKHGSGEEELRAETFNLFDVSNTGFVNKQDLKDVASLYDMSMLRGDKSDELVDKYDQDDDGRLNKDEFKSFVHDPKLPNSMPVLLRSYAKRLAEVAGNVAAARQRDEVAQRVVNYLQLVCAKNMQKMAWVAGALSDGSLPLEFTADIMGELALAMGSPEVLTKADVGSIVINNMLTLHPENTANAFRLMSNTTFWIQEGFHPSEHAICIKRVAAWISSASAGDAKALLSIGGHQKSSLLQTTEALADHAFELGEANMKAHMDSLEDLRDKAHAQMFQTKSSRLMLSHLLGGAVGVDSLDSEASRIIKAGLPARPETLLFAQTLANNATRTANRFQEMCFSYSKTSSSSLDAFATQIQGMVKKVQGFIKMMMQHSTPSGIAQLESQVHNFAQNAGKDVLKLIKHKFGSLVNSSAPLIDKALNNAIDTAGNTLGHSIATSLATPLGQALAPALGIITKQMMSGNSTSDSSASQKVGKELAAILGTEISKLSGDELGHELAKLLHKMINTAITKASKLLNSTVNHIPGLQLIEEHFADEVPLEHVLAALNEHASVHLAASQTQLNHEEEVAAASHGAEKALEEAAAQEAGSLKDSVELSGVWNEVATVLRSLSNVLPQATKTLKFARLEVSKLAANLDSLFKPLETKGTEIFHDFSQRYLGVWHIYFCILLPLMIALLCYGFWAGGFFGGPGSAESQLDAADKTPEDQKGLFERLRMSCQACCHCLCGCHDWSMGFWSFLIMLQLVVTLVFIVAFILLILGGIKAFVSSQCEQMYILGDDLICGQALSSLRSFLQTFKGDWLLSEMPKRCVSQELLVCKDISHEFQTSTIFTCVFGALASVFSFMLLVESARLHTRAVCRREAVRAANQMKE